MSKFTKAFFAFLILIIGILVVIILTPNEGHAPSDTSTPLNGTTQQNQDNEEEEQEPVVSYSTRSTDEWDELERATEGIQVLAPGQQINSVLEDPEKEDTMYFTAYVLDEEAEEILLSIYQYNTEDYSWERLFRSTYEFGGLNVEDDQFPLLELAGYDDEHLILFTHSTETEQGPCDDPLLLNNGNQYQSLRQMNIKDPYAGFSEYEPSDDTIAERTQIQQGCLRDLE